MCEICNNRGNSCPACCDNEPYKLETPTGMEWKQSVATASELAEIQSLYQWDYTEAERLLRKFMDDLKEKNPETYAYHITGLFKGILPEILVGTLSLERIRKVLLQQIYESLNTPTK